MRGIILCEIKMLWMLMWMVADPRWHLIANTPGVSQCGKRVSQQEVKRRVKPPGSRFNVRTGIEYNYRARHKRAQQITVYP